MDGLRDRLMAPEIAAEAVRAYVAETNRLNHARRSASAIDKVELDKITKAIRGYLDMIAEGHGSRAVGEELRRLEAQEDIVRARMAQAPSVAPDIHPNIAEIYRRKVERLADAVDQPAERDEAADAIRGLIERVTLFPSTRRGEITATLHGEFGTILEWVSGRKDARYRHSRSGCFGSVGIAGCGDRIWPRRLYQAKFHRMSRDNNILDEYEAGLRTSCPSMR